MEQPTEQVIERMGLFFEQDGLPRIAGRLLGYLLLSVEPRSLDDLAGALRVSRSSASTDARLLERMGMVERVTVPGDRRDYYRIAPDAAARISARWLERLTRMRDLLAEALGTPAAERALVRRRLRRGADLLEVLVEGVERAGRSLRDDDETMSGGARRVGAA